MFNRGCRARAASSRGSAVASHATPVRGPASSGTTGRPGIASTLIADDLSAATAANLLFLLRFGRIGRVQNRTARSRSLRIHEERGLLRHRRPLPSGR